MDFWNLYQNWKMVEAEAIIQQNTKQVNKEKPQYVSQQALGIIALPQVLQWLRGFGQRPDQVECAGR